MLDDCCPSCWGAGIDNLRIYAEDAVEVMEHCLGPDSLDAIHIFFPDPWHKKRQSQAPLDSASTGLGSWRALLKADGYLHLATDWAPYAEHMFEVLDAEPLLISEGNGPGTGVPRPDYRPLTKFEARGERLGHVVQDLIYRRA